MPEWLRYFKATATVSFFESKFTLKLQTIILDGFNGPLDNCQSENGNKHSVLKKDPKAHNQDLNIVIDRLCIIDHL